MPSPFSFSSPPRILVAPDSFKGSLTAGAAAAAMARGIRMGIPGATVDLNPVSDGGEGFVDLMVSALGGEIIITEVAGPMPRQKVSARWGYIAARGEAIIEMASAAGLPLVPPDRRDPCVATTFGVGELILAALDHGARSLLVGIGGSATNDGGAGMASALGAGFFDGSGLPLPPGGAALARLVRIDIGRLDSRLRQARVTVASDVTSPLTGPDGASRLFGPQKGASQAVAGELDASLQRYAEVLREQLGCDVERIPGSGAAGGLGAGLIAFCNASIAPGIDLVLDATGFGLRLAKADLVLTGEGRVDAQTFSGKALAGILRRARASNVPVAAVAGSAEGSPADLVGPGRFIALATLVDDSTPVADAMNDAAALLAERTCELLRSMS